MNDEIEAGARNLVQAYDVDARLRHHQAYRYLARHHVIATTDIHAYIGHIHERRQCFGELNRLICGLSLRTG